MTATYETAAWPGRPAPALLALLAACIAALLVLSPGAAGAQAFEPTRFSVEVTGQGPDVILIPGLSTSREVWRESAGALAGEYRLHLIQVKGFGEPAGPNAEGPVLEPLVEELARYIAENQLDRPAVAGHSLGGLIAMMLGAGHPELPGKLMIVDSLPWYGAALAPAGATPESIEPQAAALRQMLVAAYGTPAAGQSNDAAIAGYVLDKSKLPLLREWTGSADTRVTGQLIYEDLVTDMRERIATIAAPLTVAYAWNTAYPDAAQADAFYREQYAALPRVRFVGIGPAAHFLMVDQPEAFQAALKDFLTR